MNTPARDNHANDLDHGYTLRLREGKRCPGPAMLRPDVLGVLSAEQIRERLGDAFEITGTQGSTLTLRNIPALSGLGAHMASGTLIIQGNAGDDVGASMTGGVIRVQGNAGDHIGGPALEQYENVQKNTLPSTLPNNKGGDARRGMNGGTIIVQQNAGNYAGLRMRRGLIVIQGHAASCPGYRMIAGTLVIQKGDLHQPGLEMQRGTIVSLSPEATMHTQGIFENDGVFEASSLSVVGLLLGQLARLGIEIIAAMRQGNWRLSSGDRLELGKGELWQWTH